MVQDYKKLIVYQESFKLAVDTYKIFEKTKTSLRLKEQLFGSVSAIFANLAEMVAYDSKTQQKQKVCICLAESNEAEAWFDFCKEIGVIDGETHKGLTGRLLRIRYMLFKFLESIKTDIKTQKDQSRP